MRSLLFLMTLGLLALVGCSGSAPTTTTNSSSGTPAATGKLIIPVIPKGTTHEFWKSIHAGAEMAKSELKDVEIVWRGPLKEDDRDGQIAVVEDFITQKVSGIVLAPLDDVALKAPVAAAKKAGIPVVIIDSGLQGDDYASFVATDNEKGGFMAGEQMVRLLNGKGKVVMLRYQEGSASTQLREKGFLDAISKAKGIEVVSSNQYGGATAGSAQTASENLLTPFKVDGKLSIDGIFTPNESTTFGMLRCLEDAKLIGVKFVGFDASPNLVEALKGGQIDGLIVQNPVKMGYLGVKTIVAHLRGEKIETKIDTGVQLVTKKNMETPEISNLLNPPLDKWLK